MKKVFPLLFVFILGSNIIFSQTSHFLVVKGKIHPSSHANTDEIQLDIWLDGGTKLFKAISKGQDNHILAKIRLEKEYKIVRILLSKPGKKTVTKNCFLVKHQRDLIADIGQIRFAKSNGPSIENISVSISEGKYYRFGISVYNPLSRPILFNNLEIEAKTRQGEKINCNRPKGIKLYLDDKIVLSPKGNRFNTSVQDLEERNSYTVSGRFIDNYCSGIADIALNIPIELYAKQSDYSKVDLFVPIKLLVSKSEKLDTTNYEQVLDNLDFRTFEFAKILLSSSDNSSSLQKSVMLD